MTQKDVSGIGEGGMDECVPFGMVSSLDGPEPVHLLTELLDHLCRLCRTGRGCQELTRNAQWFPIDELGHRSLEVLPEGCSNPQEGQWQRFRPSHGVVAHYGCLQGAVKTFHQSIRLWMVCRCGVQADAT